MYTAGRLDYLSALDPAHAYGLEPKASAAKMLSKLEDHDKRMLELFRFNLMWRPTILLRHIDVFGNLPLLRFLHDKRSSLASAGILRVTTPSNESFEEMYRQWALGPKSQHFHHLNPDMQSAFDDACSAQNVKTLVP